MSLVKAVLRFSLQTCNKNQRNQLLNIISNCLNFVMLTAAAKSERKQLDNSFFKNLSIKSTVKGSRD